jgi:hypothetical protein
MAPGRTGKFFSTVLRNCFFGRFRDPSDPYTQFLFVMRVNLIYVICSRNFDIDTFAYVCDVNYPFDRTYYEYIRQLEITQQQHTVATIRNQSKAPVDCRVRATVRNAWRVHCAQPNAPIGWHTPLCTRKCAR